MEKTERDHIDRRRWLTALHVKGTADRSLQDQMDVAEELLRKAAEPRTIYRIMERGEISTPGISMKKHLEGCRRVIMMAATLGAGIDTLLRRTQVTDMALAVILDTGASIMIEQVCDDLQAQIRQLMVQRYRQRTEGGRDIPLYFTSRFSPGYGDYPITEQKRILRYLDASRKIGLHVTQDSLMIPRKSVTALMGEADHPVSGHLAGCGECVLRDKCTLKKEGRCCGNQF